MGIPEWKTLINNWKSKPSTCLDLRFQMMGDEGIFYLAQVIDSLGTCGLTSLLIQQNLINDCSMIALINVLRSQESLARLDVSFNNLTDETAKSLLDLSQVVAIQEIVFFENQFSSEMEALLYDMKPPAQRMAASKAFNPPATKTAPNGGSETWRAPSQTPALLPQISSPNLGTSFTGPREARQQSFAVPCGGSTIVKSASAKKPLDQAMSAASLVASMHEENKSSSSKPKKKLSSISSFMNLSKASDINKESRTLEEVEKSEADLRKKVAALESKLAKSKKKSSKAKSTKRVSSKDKYLKINLSHVAIGEMLASIGGSNAGVYSCHVDGWQCAMKELNTADMTEEETQKFLGEIHVLESLPFNKHIVRYLFHQQDNNKIRMFMTKYACSLRDKITERRRKVEAQNGGYSAGNMFTPVQIAKYSLDIAKGLMFLHENNFIHRDIKSDNIFVLLNDKKEIGELSIGDFDTAKQISTKTSAKTVIGTPCFMAPEVFQKDAYSYSADVYSFGLVIYELITLKLPYEDMLAKQPFMIPNRIMEGVKPPLPPYIPKDPLTISLLNLYEKCTELKPENRPSLSTVKDNLVAILSSSI